MMCHIYPHHTTTVRGAHSVQDVVVTHGGGGGGGGGGGVGDDPWSSMGEVRSHQHQHNKPQLSHIQNNINCKQDQSLKCSAQ